jgi:hypothetical protein
MVKLRVSVGGSYTDLSIINCNDELQPVEFDSPVFKGRIMVRVKDFGKLSGSNYSIFPFFCAPLHNTQ